MTLRDDLANSRVSLLASSALQRTKKKVRKLMWGKHPTEKVKTIELVEQKKDDSERVICS